MDAARGSGGVATGTLRRLGLGLGLGLRWRRERAPVRCRRLSPSRRASPDPVLRERSRGASPELRIAGGAKEDLEAPCLRSRRPLRAPAARDPPPRLSPPRAHPSPGPRWIPPADVASGYPVGLARRPGPLLQGLPAGSGDKVLPPPPSPAPKEAPAQPPPTLVVPRPVYQLPPMSPARRPPRHGRPPLRGVPLGVREHVLPTPLPSEPLRPWQVQRRLLPLDRRPPPGPPEGPEVRAPARPQPEPPPLEEPDLVPQRPERAAPGPAPQEPAPRGVTVPAPPFARRVLHPVQE